MPIDPNCPHCAGDGWVCENHPERPWEGSRLQNACTCGGAGMPCGLCNRDFGEDEQPALPAEFVADVGIDPATGAPRKMRH
jgi:hypothetical protein